MNKVGNCKKRLAAPATCHNFDLWEHKYLNNTLSWHSIWSSALWVFMCSFGDLLIQFELCPNITKRKLEGKLKRKTNEIECWWCINVSWIFFVNSSFFFKYSWIFFHDQCPGCSGWVGRGVLIQLWDIIHLLGCTPRNVIIELWLDGDWGSWIELEILLVRCKNTTRSVAKYQEKMPASNLFAFLGNLKLVRKEQNSAKFVTSDHCILLCGSAVHFGSYFRV